MSLGIENQIAAVLDSNHRIMGSAFRINKDYWVTCAHVIEKTDKKPGEDIFIKIYQDAICKLKIEPSGWRFEDEDIAFLKISNPIDDPFQNINLAVLIPEGGQHFQVFGFARLGSYEGLWASGFLAGVVQTGIGKQRLQLSSPDLNKGHSGAPVWCPESCQVLGMLVEIVRSSERHRDTAFAIPATVIRAFIDQTRKYPARLVGVPVLPHYHIQRKHEIRLLSEMLLDTRDSDYIVGLTGMGGVGKSVLAAAFSRAKATRQRFPDGIFWLTFGMEKGDDWLSELYSLRESCFSDGQIRGSRVKVITAIREVLASRSVLLILDDVWEISVIRSFAGLSGKSRVLVTTRDSRLIMAVGGRVVCLNVLADFQSMRLVSKWLGVAVRDLPEEVEELRLRCENHPMALAISAAMIREGERCHDLLEALEMSDLDYFNYPGANLAGVFAYSFERLNPYQQFRYLDLAAFPQGDMISEPELVRFWRLRDETAQRDYHFHRLITEFKQRALFRRLLGKSPKRMLQLHTLQYDFIVSKLGVDKVACLRRIREKMIQ